MYTRILNLCRNKGITINKLEQALSIGNGTISKWDKSCPKATTLKKVAEFFNISLEYLLSGNDLENNQTFYNSINNNKHSSITITNGEKHTRELSEIESELLKISNNLNTKNKTSLLTYAYKLENEQSVKAPGENNK